MDEYIEADISDTQEILKKCMDTETDPADICQELTTLLKKVSQKATQIEDKQHIATTILALEDVANQLRKFTREQNAIRFYYYGMFQAWSDYLSGGV